MRISRFRITNFRSLRDTGEVPLDQGVTLLLGKNENGKTNVLLAFEAFDVEFSYGSEDI